MSVSIINNYSSYLFIRNQGDIIVYTDSGDVIKSVAVTVGGVTRLTLPNVKTDENGALVIRAREILEGLALSQLGIGDESPHELYDPYIRLVITYRNSGSNADATSSKVLPWLNGGVFGTNVYVADFRNNEWLSLRKLRTKVCRWSSEHLNMFLPNESGDDNDTMIVYVTVYDGEEALFTFETDIQFHADENVDKIVTASEISYFTVRNRANYNGYQNRNITHWMIWAEGGETEYKRIVNPIIFELEESSVDWLQFHFRGSLGTSESVISRGKTIDKLDFSSKTFRHSRKEEEVGNSSIRKVETHSGYLSDDVERNLWTEFLESDVHIVRYQDGTEKRIVIDEVSCEMERNTLAGVSFTWHESEQRRGYWLGRESITPVKVTVMEMTDPSEIVVAEPDEPILSAP